MNILRLRELLKEKGVTGKELALKVGVSQPAISDITKGKSFPRPELLTQIADALKVDIKDLFHSTMEVEKQNIHLIIDEELHIFKSRKELAHYVMETYEPLKKFLLHYGKKQE